MWRGHPPDLREHIFERNVTTKTHGDHGIGLYLIENYVTQAGGTIEVTDNIPQGTIFSLFIPITGAIQHPIQTPTGADYATSTD